MRHGEGRLSHRERTHCMERGAAMGVGIYLYLSGSSQRKFGSKLKNVIKLSYKLQITGIPRCFFPGGIIAVG